MTAVAAPGSGETLQQRLEAALLVPDDHWSQSPDDVRWVADFLAASWAGTVRNDWIPEAQQIVTHVRSSLLGQQRQGAKP